MATNTQFSASATPSHRRRLLLATAGTAILWLIPYGDIVLYPVRLFVTLIHEACHALVAILTGGSVHLIALSPNGNGLTETVGGLMVLVYAAGYTGTAVAGALALLACRRSGSGSRVLATMALCAGLVTVLWVRNGFGLMAGAGVTLVLWLLAARLRRDAADLVAAVLAVQLSLNALGDVRILLWLTTATNAANDAVFMTEHFGMWPWFWALLWAGMSGTLLFGALRAYWRGR